MKNDVFYGKGTDPLTNEIFIKSRNNQKFATRQNQTRFNNLKARKKRSDKSKTDRLLDQNRNSLIRLLGNQREIFRSKDFLLGAGYKLEHYTSFFHQGSFATYCCYDYCIVKLENNNYKIFRNV